MFYAARAALIHVGETQRALAKTHSGLVAAFGQLVVQPGKIDVEHGRAFSHELNRRLVADYDSEGVSDEAASEALGNATRFVAAVDLLIDR